MTILNRERVRERYDVVIAGARVAGASTALLLARAGMKVLVVDPASRGTDTLSTHALMRAAVLQLSRWGILDAIRASGTPRIDKTTFHYGSAEPVEVPIEPRDGVDGLYAPRRTVLDRLLVEAAEDAGATVLHGVTMTGLLRDGTGRVTGATIASPAGSTQVAADLVVGADGVRSHVAQWVEAPLLHHIEHASASIYGYVPGLEPDGYHWHFGSQSAMGTIPTTAGDTCIFASLEPARLLAERSRGLDTLFLELLDELAPPVAEHTRRVGIPKLRGFAGLPSHLRQAHGPGWLLVGDAGYFRDPLTAHGIADALRDVELFARAIVSGEPGALVEAQATRDELAREIMDITGEIASLSHSLAELSELHVQLSRAMTRGVETVSSWGESSSPEGIPATVES